jgi:hypothetical protein
MAVTRPSVLDDLPALRARRAEIAREGGRGCQACGATSGVIRYHQRTMYRYDGGPGDADDPNMVTLCPPCRAENDAYWDERWEEYYGGLL